MALDRVKSISALSAHSAVKAFKEQVRKQKTLLLFKETACYFEVSPTILGRNSSERREAHIRGKRSELSQGCFPTD